MHSSKVISRAPHSAKQSPIRKQSPEARRSYMKEYMRSYRLQHPGLSTPYVRNYRQRKPQK